MTERYLHALLVLLVTTCVVGCSTITDVQENGDIELMLTGNIDKDFAKPGLTWVATAPVQDEGGRHFDLIMTNRALGDATFEYSITFNGQGDEPQDGSYSIETDGSIQGDQLIVVRWPVSAESSRFLTITVHPTLLHGSQTAHLALK